MTTEHMEFTEGWPEECHIIAYAAGEVSPQTGQSNRKTINHEAHEEHEEYRGS